MDSPNQATWLVKKFFSMRKFTSMTDNLDEAVVQGKFSIKKCYILIRVDVQKVAWKTIVFSNPAPPKTVFVSWIALHGKLRTKDIVSKWCTVPDLKCPLCAIHDESTAYIFFNCCFSKSVWNAILNWLQVHRRIRDWSLEWQWIARVAKGKSAKG